MLEAFAIREEDGFFAGDGVHAVAVQPPHSSARDDEPPAWHAEVVQRVAQTIRETGGDIDGILR